MIRARLVLTASAVIFGFFTIAPFLLAGDKPKETVLYNFPLHFSGYAPESSLVFDEAGNLYGSTLTGGENDCNYDFGCGTVFVLTPQASGEWSQTVIYNFTGGADGCGPSGNLLLGGDGNLYGTASGYAGADGPCSYGTVFELSPSTQAQHAWTFRLLYSFRGGTDGMSPQSLIFDAAGNLYGVTEGEYGDDGGTIFELSPENNGTWKEKVLHYFGFQDQAGYFPMGGVTFDAAGNLYGITQDGGPYGSSCNPINRFYPGCGTVFELSPGSNGEWTETVLHEFNYTDGANAGAGLISDADGNLYGTTMFGGAFGAGLVFELSSGANGGWTEEVLHQFGGTPGDGDDPAGVLIFDTAGNLYGTTIYGGPISSDCRLPCGTVFGLRPDSKTGGWTERVLNSFNGVDGAGPDAGLIFDSAGNLYGDTVGGGVDGGGTVFEITP